MRLNRVMMGHQKLGHKMANAMNTLNLSQIEAALTVAAEKYGAKVGAGVKGGLVNHEDGLPWFEVSGGLMGYKTAKMFAQDLANGTRCRILLNKAWHDGAQGVMDFDEAHPSEDGVLPALKDPEVGHYGEIFMPR